MRSHCMGWSCRYFGRRKSGSRRWGNLRPCSRTGKHPHRDRRPGRNGRGLRAFWGCSVMRPPGSTSDLCRSTNATRLTDSTAAISTWPSPRLPRCRSASGGNDFLPIATSALSDAIMCNPAVYQTVDLETYVTTPHILATLAADDRGIVDEALAKLGLRRRVAVTVPNIYLIPRLVAETGMISHLPRRIATEMLRGYDLVMLSPPVALPEWHIDMYWGAASASEPTTSWIRSTACRAHWAAGRG